ncbi:uncharacterized protein [Gossypium hirsutum]|uniref:DNA/RNA polymerases superfamily protein n=1 Tax=Gossypium hirsutum TaxID=3635 RepID=A0ABM2ZHX8_GOSHI|nr:uncharacterized protein LOC121213553 [Gossypium hirsutum]
MATSNQGQRALGQDTNRIDARQPALVYIVRGHEDRDASNAIVGFSHSYVACAITDKLGIWVEKIANDVTVVSPLGQSVIVSLDYAIKRVTMKMTEGNEIIMVGERRNYLSNMISAILAEKLVQKGCEAYLAYVLDFSARSVTVESIRTVREFLDVFPKELPRLPLNREVGFEIKLLLRTTPVSIALYHMTPKELKELKVQLQELLDCGFIKPNVSPYGASVLFVKNKDGSLRLCTEYR